MDSIHSQGTVASAERALRALESQDYGENGMYQEGTPDIVDILADLMHYADIFEQDFEESMRIARNHYQEERDGNT